MGTIERTVRVNVTPREMAAEFAEWTADDQAEFWSELGSIVRQWPGASWGVQAIAMCERLEDRGAAALSELADAYIASITPL